jgi:signal transduction histidine kinase
MLMMAVRDTGCGIAADHLPRIFDRFWQVQRQGRKGLGLGLAIGRGIIDAHGGRIWVESALGSGTTFLFTLPLAETATTAR